MLAYRVSHDYAGNEADHYSPERACSRSGVLNDTNYARPRELASNGLFSSCFGDEASKNGVANDWIHAGPSSPRSDDVGKKTADDRAWLMTELHDRHRFPTQAISYLFPLSRSPTRDIRFQSFYQRLNAIFFIERDA